MEKDAAEIKCILCGKTATKKCGDCGAVAYCSEECHEKHWKTHEEWCGKIREIVAEFRNKILASPENLAHVGAPNGIKRGREKEEEGGAASSVDLPLEPETKRIKTAIDEISNAIKKFVPAGQTTAEAVATTVTEILKEHKDWWKQRPLLAAYVKTKAEESIFSQETLQWDVLARIIELAGKDAATVAVYRKKPVAHIDLVRVRPKIENLAGIPIVDALVRAKIMDPADDDSLHGLYMIAKNLFLAWINDGAFLVRLGPGGEAQNLLDFSVHKGVLGAAYAQTSQKVGMLTRGGKVLLVVDASADDSKKTKIKVRLDKWSDTISTFGGDMFVVMPVGGGRGSVFGPSNGWTSPIYDDFEIAIERNPSVYEMSHTKQIALYSAGNMIVTEDNGDMLVHRFSRAANSFSATRYATYRVAAKSVADIMIYAGGMRIQVDFDLRRQTVIATVWAPASSPTAISVLESRRFERGLPEDWITDEDENPVAPTESESEQELLCWLYPDVRQVMDGVALIQFSEVIEHEERKLENYTFRVFWLVRDPQGDVAFVTTELDLPRNIGSKIMFYAPVCVCADPRIAAVVLRYRKGEERKYRSLAYVVEVDTGRVLTTIKLAPSDRIVSILSETS